MSRLDPQKLHVTVDNVSPSTLNLPRHYTLTYSYRTGDLYLKVASDFNQEQISGLCTRLLRDEVLAEWKMEKDLIFLHVDCNVSGRFVCGTSSLHESIFRRELPLVFEAPYDTEIASFSTKTPNYALEKKGFLNDLLSAPRVPKTKLIEGQIGLWLMR